MRVCILDSGVEQGHPLVGELVRAVAIRTEDGGDPVAEEDTEGDLCGHGTAGAGINRRIAPNSELLCSSTASACFRRLSFFVYSVSSRQASSRLGTNDIRNAQFGSGGSTFWYNVVTSLHINSGGDDGQSGDRDRPA